MSKRTPARLSLTRLEDRWTPAAGDLDFSFGDQGVFAIPGIPGIGAASVSDLDLIDALPDGRIVFANRLTDSRPSATDENRFTVQVGRLLADGRLDPTFGTDGTTRLPFATANELLIQPDGRILVIDGHLGVRGQFTVGRLTADGQLDVGFGTDGVARVPVGGGIADALAVGPDGRVVVAGKIDQGDVPSTDGGLRKGTQGFAVVRLTTEGRPDPTFDGDGLAAINFPVGEYNLAEAGAVAVQPDGKVVLAGQVSIGQGSGTIGPGSIRQFYDTDIAVARLNADGSPDRGFGIGGRTQVGFASSESRLNAEGQAVRVLADGRIAVAGTTRSRGTPTGFGVATVLTPAGLLDPAYDGDGRAVTPFGLIGPEIDRASVGDVLVLPDGGTQFRAQDGLLYRLTPAGSADAGFGDNGLVRLSSASFRPERPYYSPASVIPLSDGGLAAVSTLSTPTDVTAGGVVVRYRGTGPARFAPATAQAIQAGGLQDGSVEFLAPVDGEYVSVGGTTVYPNFPGTVRTATADVTGDGIPDYVAGPGPGGGPNVVVLDGKTGARIADLDAFETTFTGGVYVAAADLDGDGKAEVIVTPDRGGGPVVVVYDGAGLAAGRDEAAERTRFFGIDDPAFRGGARAAAGDVDGNGRPDLVVAAGFGGGPRVAVYAGGGLFSGGLPARLVPDFFVFEQTLRNGVFVTAGDLTGDGAAELVFGGGPGGGPRVFALDGRALAGGTETPVANFFAGDAASRGGVHVSVRTDLAEGTAAPRIVTGSGEGEVGRVRVFTTAGEAGRELTPFGGGELAEGVFVG